MDILWKDKHIPTHKCKICGAFWRLWLKEDLPYTNTDSWSLFSKSCGKCCDNVPMDEQINPLTLGEMNEIIKNIIKDEDK